MLPADVLRGNILRIKAFGPICGCNQLYTLMLRFDLKLQARSQEVRERYHDGTPCEFKLQARERGRYLRKFRDGTPSELSNPDIYVVIPEAPRDVYILYIYIP